jgi:hypothetical protein
MDIFDDVSQVSVSKMVCSYHGAYSFVFVQSLSTSTSLMRNQGYIAYSGLIGMLEKLTGCTMTAFHLILHV